MSSSKLMQRPLVPKVRAALVCGLGLWLTAWAPVHAQPRLQRGAPPGTKVLRELAYVQDGHERQKLDLYLPKEGTNWPLIVWVHGGAWRAGSKTRCPAVRFIADGYAVASINYRLSQHAIFPAQIEDCKAAIRWLRAHAKEYGYDPNRIGVWGASAGGHLVALLGTTGDTNKFEVGAYLEQSSAVQAVVDFFGPTDLGRLQEQAGLRSQLDHDAADSPESLLLGGPLQQNLDKAAVANPITYVSADDPPFLIMHGDQDFTVPIGQSELLNEALQKAGVSSKFEVVPDAGHGFGGPEIDRALRNFWEEQLKPATD